jgi:uncharacterized membrane protein YqjE
MNAASYVFFGLLLIPLVVFLAWLIKKDNKKNHLGLLVLIAMAIIALIAIIKFDTKFMNTGEGSRLKKSQMPSYR